MKEVLVPTDFSEVSEQALDHAVRAAPVPVTVVKPRHLHKHLLRHGQALGDTR